MPEICRFLGIVITMYHRDHTLAHFHVFYAEYEASFALEPLRMLSGKLPPRVLGLVMEWASLHSDELRDDWVRASRREPLRRIAPLE